MRLGLRGHLGEIALFGGVVVICAIVIGGAGSPIFALILPVACFVSLVLLQKPEFGVAALAFVTYTNLADVMIERHGIPSLTKLLFSFLVAVTVVRWALGRQRLKFPIHAIIAISLYSAIRVASIFYAADPNVALERNIDFIKEALIGLLFATLTVDAVGLRRNVWAALFAGGMISAMSTYQVLTGDYYLDFGGLARAGINQIVGEVDAFRITGPLTDPNFYAQVLVPLVPIAIDRLMHERTVSFKLVAVAILACLMTSIVFTYSRGGLFAMFCVTVAMAALSRPRPAYIGTVVLIGMLLLPMLPESYYARFSAVDKTLDSDVRGSDASIEGRLGQFRVAAAMILDNPLLGVGTGNYAVHFQNYTSELSVGNRREDREAHSLYLEVLADQGMIGFTAFIVMLASLVLSVRAGMAGMRSAGLPEEAGLGRAIGIGLAGYFISSLWLHSAWAQYFWLLAGLCWSLPAVAAVEHERLRGHIDHYEGLDR